MSKMNMYLCLDCGKGDQDCTCNSVSKGNKETMLSKDNEIAELQRKLWIALETIKESKRMFQLILVPPIEQPKTAYEYGSLWERDKRDATNAIWDIDHALSKINGELG